jgi:hypothetical protein
MSTQTSIDFAAAPEPSPLEAAFRAWLDSDDGRRVYSSVRDRALALRARGWLHFGIRPLWESARYDSALDVGPDCGFKLNDHHHSRLARELMRREPELDGFFTVRDLRS